MKPLIDITMWGNSQAVDEHMERLFLLNDSRNHYLRLNVRILNEEFSDMAISTDGATNHYEDRFKIDYLENAEVQATLDKWLVDSGVVRPSEP